MKKIIICFLSSILFFLATNVYAEYYLVYPPMPCGAYYYDNSFNVYNQCPPPCMDYVYIHSKAPYRHASKSGQQMSEYAWIGDP